MYHSIVFCTIRASSGKVTVHYILWIGSIKNKVSFKTMANQEIAPTPTEVESLGGMGINYFRPEGRSYNNREKRITNYHDLRTEYNAFHTESLNARRKELGPNAPVEGRRRCVFRTICTADTFAELIQSNELPLEVAIPLDVVHPEESDYLIMLAENTHASEIPEWPEVYAYWQESTPTDLVSPQERVLNLAEQYTPTTELFETDVDRLTELWQPFGWQRDAVALFISKLPNTPTKWFAGIRDAAGELVSACTAEQLQFPTLTLIETTEYGTLADHEGQGLCTAAVTVLVANILSNTLYRPENPTDLPLMVAELNMSSRSDIAARRAGMTIPLVENVPHLDETPIQVLRQNVSVLDRRPINNTSYYDQENRQHFRNAYRDTYHRYWRNFIYGVLPETAVQEFYAPEQVQQILALTQNAESSYADPLS